MMKTHVHTNTYTNVLCSIIPGTAKSENTLNVHQLTHGSNVVLHTVDYYSATNRNETLMFIYKEALNFRPERPKLMM